MREAVTLSKSEFIHRRKWSEGFRLVGHGKPTSAKNCKKSPPKTCRAYMFWDYCTKDILSTRETFYMHTFKLSVWFVVVWIAPVMNRVHVFCFVENILENVSWHDSLVYCVNCTVSDFSDSFNMLRSKRGMISFFSHVEDWSWCLMIRPF